MTLGQVLPMTVSSRDPRAGPSLSRYRRTGLSLTLGVRSPVTLFVVLVIRLRGSLPPYSKDK